MNDTQPHWGSLGGRKTLYPDLTDGHLKNIIKDGYRNPHIIEEAKARGFDVPERPIDKLSFKEVMMWVESYASCAIEGNVLAERMSKLWDKDRAAFMFQLNSLLVLQEEEK